MPSETSRPWATVVAMVAGPIIAFIIEALPVIGFWWHLIVGLLFLVSGMLFCLRPPHDISGAIPLLHSPYLRQRLSIVVFLVVSGILWMPLRRQYLEEHMPPSLIYVIPVGVWSANPVQWIMFVRRYGPASVHHPEVLFFDMKRAQRLAAQKSITEDQFKDEQTNLTFDEIDRIQNPILPEHFLWTPLDPDHQYYLVTLTLPEWQLFEGLAVEKMNSKWVYEMKVTDKSWRTIIECRDPGFPVASGPTQPTCWDYVWNHYGDARLPLETAKRTSSYLDTAGHRTSRFCPYSLHYFCLLADG